MVSDFSSSELEGGQISLPELGKMFKTPTDEKAGFLKKIYYAGFPGFTIILAELMIFGGRLKEASIIYTLLLLVLSFSTAVTKRQEIRKVHQAFLLLPIFRLVNLSMPIFLKIDLYSFIFIYAPLAMSVIIATAHKDFMFEKKRDIFKRIWVYIPFSIVAGLAFAEAEYLLIGFRALIPDLSQANLLGLIIIMVFIVALLEEFIFRAILQTRLEEFLGPAGGIFLASLLFGAMHSSYGTLYEMPYAFLVGCFLGYSFYKTRSLTLVILIHGSINVFLFGIIPHLGPGLGFI